MTVVEVGSGKLWSLIRLCQRIWIWNLDQNFDLNFRCKSSSNFIRYHSFPLFPLNSYCKIHLWLKRLNLFIFALAPQAKLSFRFLTSLQLQSNGTVFENLFPQRKCVGNGESENWEIWANLNLWGISHKFW